MLLFVHFNTYDGGMNNYQFYVVHKNCYDVRVVYFKSRGLGSVFWLWTIESYKLHGYFCMFVLMCCRSRYLGDLSDVSSSFAGHTENDTGPTDATHTTLQTAYTNTAFSTDQEKVSHRSTDVKQRMNVINKL